MVGELYGLDWTDEIEKLLQFVRMCEIYAEQMCLVFMVLPGCAERTRELIKD